MVDFIIGLFFILCFAKLTSCSGSFMFNTHTVSTGSAGLLQACNPSEDDVWMDVQIT